MLSRYGFQKNNYGLTYALLLLIVLLLLCNINKFNNYLNNKFNIIF